MPVRLCVFGDIHGNAVALHAVLAAIAAEDADLLACTGDCVFGWGQPEACLQAVAAVGCPWVTGNADQAVLGTPGFRPAGPAAAAWNRERLGPAGLRRLAALPAGIRLHLRLGGTVHLVHGCPPARIEPGVRPAGLHEWTDNVTDDGDVEAGWGAQPPDLLLCGHTHVPTVRRIGPTLICNPGSVGYGIHPAAPARYQTGNAVARYAVLDWDGIWRAAIRAVPYDTESALAALEGLPWLDAIELRRRAAFLQQAPVAPGPEPVQG